MVLVISVNVRRFLSPMIGIRRECLESPGSLKVNPRRKRPVLRTFCKFAAECSNVGPPFEPISRSCIRLFGGTGKTTFACDQELRAVHIRKNGQKEREKSSTREFNFQRESSVSRFQSRLPSFESGDSNDWLNIPTIGLKNRRTFTLFTMRDVSQ